MRLICGLYRFDGAAATADSVSAMARGMVATPLKPDIRLWTGGAVGLAVVDFASSSPGGPLLEDGDGVLAADRRLDAPADLGERLDCRGADDDRLVAAAIARWGGDAPDHILGDFAFAHWQPATGRLLCARDLFGVRPFHYIWRPGELFAFASFPAGLHAASLTPRIFDRMALARHLVQRQQPDESLFTGVARLPAAHGLEVSPSGLSVRRYWNPDAVGAGDRRVTPEAAAVEMRSRLDEAVRCRLPRSGKAGAHLSGGLDSSAITVLAARELRERGEQLHAWSFLDVQRNDVVLEDEAAFVQSVLDQEPGIAWAPVRLPRDDIDPGPYHSDLPLPLGPDNPDCAVCAEAAAAGVTVILSGWGGDEGATFNGRGVLAEHVVRGRWRTLARELSAIRRARGTAIATTIRTEILPYLLPAFVSGARARNRADGLPERLMACLSPAVSAELEADGHGGPSLYADARKNRANLIGSPHIAQRCENWAALGAQHGVAFAFPMLDRRLVEYTLSLPGGVFLRDGWKRRVFRDAMRGILPDLVRERHGKATPFPAMPLIFAEQRAMLAARIEAAAGDATVSGLFDIDQLRDQAEALPDPETLKAGLTGNATPDAAIPALRHPLRMAAFVAQDP
ncbi:MULTISPECIES: asparagine synthase-related protein [unclassified Sphingomonas]|uniref:asparagine synthase-related protein n=1 Tax=unclassified Sphingomonas TaxID=196159 RepID=UPI000ABE1B84|nr:MULTISPECIES: asparagine synthase-related protein [unclassified Sphingomonas]